MIFEFLILITVVTVAVIASLNALMSGSTLRRGALIVTFLCFLAWSWTMAYLIAINR
jgi:hypothetical protein